MAQVPMQVNFPLRSIVDDDSRYYTLEEFLGGGVAGKVYRAKRRDTGKYVACKVQNMTNFTMRELDTWFKSAKATPFVAQVLDAAHNAQTNEARIYSELLDGGNLDTMMKDIYKTRRRVHPLIIAHVSLQLAWALTVIQSLHILHRDIKPDNALLTVKLPPELNRALWHLREGKALAPDLEPPLNTFLNSLYAKNDRLCVLTDFGFGRDETDWQNRSTATMMPGSQFGWHPGTTAPEFYFQNWQSPMADVYSFGALIHILCTGVYPAPGAPFAPLPDCYGAELQQLVAECLSIDPLKRPHAGNLAVRLWNLKMAEAQRLNESLKAHNHYKQVQAQWAAEQARQAEIQRQAALRDQQALSEWQRAELEWKMRVADVEDRERAGLSARPNARFDKAQRMAHLAQTNAMVQQGGPVIPSMIPPMPESGPSSSSSRTGRPRRNSSVVIPAVTQQQQLLQQPMPRLRKASIQIHAPAAPPLQQVNIPQQAQPPVIPQQLVLPHRAAPPPPTSSSRQPGRSNSSRPPPPPVVIPDMSHHRAAPQPPVIPSSSSRRQPSRSNSSMPPQQPQHPQQPQPQQWQPQQQNPPFIPGSPPPAPLRRERSRSRGPPTGDITNGGRRERDREGERERERERERAARHERHERERAEREWERAERDRETYERERAERERSSRRERSDRRERSRSRMR